MVGVNAFTEGSDEDQIPLLQITNEDETRQLKRLEQVRQDRDQAAVDAALRRVEAEAADPEINLMPALDRRRQGRTPHSARSWRSLGTGVRAPRRSADDLMATPDVGPASGSCIAKVGLDGHDRGIKVVARILRDAGYEVILHRAVPDPANRRCCRGRRRRRRHRPVDAVGRSHDPRPTRRQRDSRRGVDIPVIVGGIVPEPDIAKLEEAGIAAVLDPRRHLRSRSSPRSPPRSPHYA